MDETPPPDDPPDPDDAGPLSGASGPGSWSRAVGLGVLAAVLVLGLALVGFSQADLDGDGRNTWDEVSVGTTPWDADTDGDGLADGFELDRDLDPLAADTDGDGVDDRRELGDRTNPRDPDTDDDGLDDERERELGTDPGISDTDRDEVSDGRESEVGTDPLAGDTDGDGLDDGRELVLGASPWVKDTDGDGLGDLAEVRQGVEDCDGDGVSSIAEADDDADSLRDVDEEPDWRCDRDTDGDGIEDGLEASLECVPVRDCDGDALPDPEEMGTKFDRLDPDTFDVGLLDGVSSVFEQAGQPPSPDGDDDGIPDAWELSTGLIDWEYFDPEPGDRDLLVEFVRVEGPDSSVHGPGSFADSYQRVASFFERDGNVELSWIETTVGLDEERRPPILPSSSEDYYREILSRARASGNPYVTTVVMNPQHDQSQTTHQGIAPIRGMLAAVDYGAHTRVTFESDRSTFTISPLVESLIVADRTELLGSRGITGGGQEPDGDMFLTSDNWRLTWGPFWFQDPPVQRFDDGTTLVYRRSHTDLDQAELADTIAHEIGHTLGLCHLTLEDCRANLSVRDRNIAGVSTMDPRREGPGLAFLDSEWNRLREYLTCPPQRSVGLIADGANRAQVVDAKYAVTLENVLNVNTRECQDFQPVPGNLEPVFDPTTYVLPVAFTEADLDEPATVYEAQSGDRVPAAPRTGAGATWLYALASLAVAGGIGAATWAWRSGRIP